MRSWNSNKLTTHSSGTIYYERLCRFYLNWATKPVTDFKNRVLDCTSQCSANFYLDFHVSLASCQVLPVLCCFFFYSEVESYETILQLRPFLYHCLIANYAILNDNPGMEMEGLKSNKIKVRVIPHISSIVTLFMMKLSLILAFSWTKQFVPKTVDFIEVLSEIVVFSATAQFDI